MRPSNLKTSSSKPCNARVSSSNLSKKSPIVNSASSHSSHYHELSRSGSRSPPATHQDFLNLISVSSPQYAPLISTQAQREDIQKFVLSQRQMQEENDTELTAISNATNHTQVFNENAVVTDFGSFARRSGRHVSADDLSELTTPEDQTTGGLSGSSHGRSRDITKVLDELTDHELAVHLERVVKVSEERRILHNQATGASTQGIPSNSAFSAPIAHTSQSLMATFGVTERRLTVPPPTPCERAVGGFTAVRKNVPVGLSPKSLNSELCSALSLQSLATTAASHTPSGSASTSAGVSVSGDSMFVSVCFSREKRQRSKSGGSEQSFASVSVKKPMPTRTPVALRHSPSTGGHSCLSPPPGVVTVFPVSLAKKNSPHATAVLTSDQTLSRHSKFASVACSEPKPRVCSNQRDLRSAALLLRKSGKTSSGRGQSRSSKRVVIEPILEEEAEMVTSPLLRRPPSRMNISPVMTMSASQQVASAGATPRRSPATGKACATKKSSELSPTIGPLSGGHLHRGGRMSPAWSSPHESARAPSHAHSDVLDPLRAQLKLSGDARHANGTATHASMKDSRGVGCATTSYTVSSPDPFLNHRSLRSPAEKSVALCVGGYDHTNSVGIGVGYGLRLENELIDGDAESYFADKDA